MAEVYYRLKSAGGDFTRVVGTSPIAVTGLTDGVLYEYAQGDDTLAEIMPGVAPSVATAPTISGARVGETPTANAGTYNGSPAPTVAPGSFLLDGTAYGGGALQAADEGKTLTYTGEVATNALDSVTASNVSATVAAALSVSDADAADYISRAEANGGGTPNTAVITAIDDFFIALKANGHLTRMGTAGILAAWPNLAGVFTPLVSTMPALTPFNFVSADYDPATGLIGDEATKYIDTGYANDADLQNDKHMAVWVNSRNSANVQTYMGAGGFETGASAIGQVDLIDQIFLRNNAKQDTRAGGTSTGLQMSNRLASTGYRYLLGGSASVQTNTTVSETPVAENYYIFGRNVDGAAGSFSGARISFFSAGSSIPSGEETLFRSSVDQFLTDLATALA